jgi:hypothetical protein
MLLLRINVRLVRRNVTVEKKCASNEKKSVYLLRRNVRPVR